MSPCSLVSQVFRMNPCSICYALLGKRFPILLNNFQIFRMSRREEGK